MADDADIDRSTYNYYEDGTKECDPVDKLKKIAELLGVELTELMDEYNLFLYHNQSKQIHRMQLYRSLAVSGRLILHCLQMEDAVIQRLDWLIPQLARTAGATEQLKAADAMKCTAEQQGRLLRGRTGRELYPL